jgi:hypothetical protein
MPSTSKKQHNFMAAVAKNPKFAKKVGVPRSVGEEFLTADKGKKFREGGEMKEYSKGGKTKKMAMGGMSMPSAKQTAAALNAMKKRMAPGNAAPRKKSAAPSMPGLPKPTMKKGGLAHSDMAKDKPMMKKVAKEEVKSHEKKMHGMAKGGVAKTVTKEMEYDYKTGKKSFAGSTAKRDAHAEKEGKRVAKDLEYDMKKYAKGGSIDGCATRGKTQGTMIKMASGGMAKKRYC